MAGARAPRTRLSRSERSSLALSEPLSSGLLRMIYDGEPGQYASYPVIAPSTPESLDWLSTRDTSEINDLLQRLLVPVKRHRRRRKSQQAWIRVDGRRI